MATKGKEWMKTMHNVFDEFTNRNLFSLIGRGYFDGVESAIALGKEANVFTAKRKDGSRVILKIYRLETCDFNKMHNYLREDPRYAGLRGKRRKIIFRWVQREFKNLFKSREGGVRVPLPIAILFNILILEYIGDDDGVAPRLISLKPHKKGDFYKKVIGNIKKMYHAGLVHADLSPFNILNFHDEPVFIDLSQACPLNHPRAEEFLRRDIKNVCRHFVSLGLNVSEEKVYKEVVTGGPRFFI